MPRALKGRMPRLCIDHRSTAAKKLRPLYDDLIQRFPVSDALSRREALLVAQSWVKYQYLSAEIERLIARKRGPGSALAIRRLERQQRHAISTYHAGIERLKELTQGPRAEDLARSIAAAQRARQVAS
jgi:hypothetical protein